MKTGIAGQSSAGERHWQAIGQWFCFRALPAATGLLVTLLLVTISPARAAGELGEDGAGQMRWHDRVTGTYQAAITQQSSLDVRVAGMLAVVQLEQVFHNTTQSWQEGIYSFPLPEDAAVRRLEMQVGDRVVIGKVREREEAKVLYRQAKAAGKKASLVEQQRPNLFTNRIANIAPGEQVTVRLQYVQTARYNAGRFTLRIPTTLTARYIPGISRVLPEADAPALSAVGMQGEYPGWSLPTDEVPDAPAITPYLYPQAGSDSAPLNPLHLQVELDAGMPLAEVQALYHELSLARDGQRYRLHLAHGPAEMDRDVVLQWRPVTGAMPRAALFTEQLGEETFGLLMVLPPELAPQQANLPREVVFVVDVSGSMAGVSIQQAREALALALRQLRPGDRFNILAFDDNVRPLFASAVPATRHHLAQAGEFVRQLAAGGGTEMRPALERALASTAEEETPLLRQVIFITDGAVGNEQALFELIEQRLGRSRLFTVGIGSAPNHWFMQRAAQAGRGFSVQVGDVGEAAGAMTELFARIAAPLAADVRVEWPQAVEAWPERVPDLYRGQPLIQAVRFTDALPAGEVTVSAVLVGESWQTTMPVPAQPGNTRHEGVASVWARSKIAGLMALKSAGQPEEGIRTRVLEVALAHQLLSPYTSFVAIEERVSREPTTPLRSGAVPNTRPRGQGHQPYAYPNTATTGPAKAFMGCFALFIALLVHVMRRPEEDRV
ncbi:marine proteobacterial sortase target protein [Parahaliea aestuarii]|uniref:Marine proteobacterial sortase target protein n=1 Tax=Parahaliea aestuarii TaxID=1852021 RepID=A0A5C8ZMG8_9GAMM|nr:marine proteobacterial sortase target protein [Parahaliea aestuarii]TXS88962.1 marine proteobacterial sortase target protein [Parahaliea aestuarii]